VLSYFARMLPFDDFEQVCERFRVLTDLDGSHRDHVDAREARNVTSGFVGAEFLLRARGGVPAGAAMIAVLDACVQVEFAADVAELRERCGENAPMVLWRRTDDAAGRAGPGGGGMTMQEWIERLRNCRSQTTSGVAMDPRVIVAAAINGRVRQIGGRSGRGSWCTPVAGNGSSPVRCVMCCRPCGNVVFIPNAACRLCV
jgi:hypothetical protein